MNYYAPRILLFGDTPQATGWIGVAKKVGKQLYDAKVGRHLWKPKEGVKIEFRNYFFVEWPTWKPGQKYQQADIVKHNGKEWFNLFVGNQSEPMRGNPTWNLHYRICKIHITVSGVQPVFAVTWIPEGLLLTPRSAEVPYGYGFPKRDRFNGTLIDPPFGTKIEAEEYECLNQVLINKFYNNKYLDKLPYISGIPNIEEVAKQDQSTFIDAKKKWEAAFATDFRFRAEFKRNDPDNEEEPGDPDQVSYYYYAPLFYTPADKMGNRDFWEVYENKIRWVDNPGINRWKIGNFEPRPLIIPKKPEGNNFVELKFRQFDDLGDSLLYEAESVDATWYCHWPEELLYDNGGYEMLFQTTNQYRDEVNKTPLHREIRGHVNTARIILEECQRTKVMYHDNEELYRQGYQTVTQRTMNAGNNYYGVGENLLINSTLNVLNAASGEAAADQWKNSPPHYANMIATAWDQPINSTSHEIFGGVPATVTEVQYEGVLDEPYTGSMWSQVFTRRRYWIMAGNINQTTKYGSVSFFWNSSPIGLGYTVASTQELFVYFQGRQIFVNPIFDKFLEGYFINMLGAAIFKSNDMLYVRVIFAAFLPPDSPINYYVYSRPLFANHVEEWIEDLIVPIENDIVGYSTASFDYEGERAILTRISLDYNRTASYFFSNAANQFVAFACSLSFLEYYNEDFNVKQTSTGPVINYTVETATYVDEHSDSFDYITHYLQECDNEEGVLMHPFYVQNVARTTTELKYLKVKYHWKINQNRTGYLSPVYQNDWEITETLVFPSGKELIVKKASAVSNPSKTAMLLEEDSYVIIFLYIDAVNQDCVYIKMKLRGEGTAVYGQATVYADLYDNNEPLVVATFSESVLNASALSHPNLGAAWETGEPTESVVCYNIIHHAHAFRRSTTGVLYPIFQVLENEWKCINYTGALRAYANKPLEGTHFATLDMAFADYANCIYNPTTEVMNFTYNANLKIADYGTDGTCCYATRYKDKFVVQIKTDLDKSIKLWNIPFTEKNIVWANFDISDLVDMGELTDILPFGAIL